MTPTWAGAGLLKVAIAYYIAGLNTSFALLHYAYTKIYHGKIPISRQLTKILHSKVL